MEVVAGERPERRQGVADAVCRYLRGAGEVAPAAQEAVALLAVLARQHPDGAVCGGDAACDAGCESCLDLELDGAALPDVDFGGCRLGAVSFADTRLRGDCVFAGAWFNRAADFGRARFRADADHVVSFADATFAREAWFWKARFAGAVSFQRCVFGGRVHLIQPAVDLTGARLTADAREKGQEWPEGQDWPLGWRTASDLEDDGAALVVLDTSLTPYHLHLADPDPEVRLAGLRILGELGDAEPDLRERIADTVCAYLHTPLSFDVTADVFDLAPAQFAELRARRAAQRLLTDRTRPAPGGPLWEDIDLQLSGDLIGVLLG